MSDSEAISGQVVGPLPPDLKSARALTVEADEILVVVFPGHVNPTQLNAHRDHLTRILGTRFMLIAGDDIMLAKVKDDNWARPAIERQQ